MRDKPPSASISDNRAEVRVIDAYDDIRVDDLPNPSFEHMRNMLARDAHSLRRSVAVWSKIRDGDPEMLPKLRWKLRMVERLLFYFESINANARSFEQWLRETGGHDRPRHGVRR